MNETVKPSTVMTTASQIDFSCLTPPPALLPDESMQRYLLMRQTILTDMAPQTAIEWLVVTDIIELSWEIERYRVLRHKAVNLFRQQAIEQSLRRIDVIELSTNHDESANRHLRRNAVEWQTDPDAALELEARLAVNGIDGQTISAESFIQAREYFLQFNALLDSAQNRRTSLLREIKTYRGNRRRLL
jgi:hypothetical protein